MLILALESSAKPASVAVVEVQLNQSEKSVKLLGQYYQNNGFSHSRTLMVMVKSLIGSLGIKPEDFSLVAVANGPGSFTGVRIGVSAAKGLALGLDLPVCGVSTLEAMAHQTAQQDVIICPVMDARRNQVYNALFERKDGVLIRLCEDRVISLDDLIVELNSFDKPCMPIGDGSDLVLAKKQDVNLLTPCHLIKYQTAFGVALAAACAKTVSAAELEPFYLRPSQAEREANQ